MAQQDVTLPPQFAVETRIFGNPVQQLLRNSISEKAEIQQISENRTLLIMESGSKILVLKSGSSSSEEFDGSKAGTLDPCFTIYVVQPGLSKSAATRDQLELLASTELYLKEACDIPLRAAASS